MIVFNKLIRCGNYSNFCSIIFPSCCLFECTLQVTTMTKTLQGVKNGLIWCCISRLERKRLGLVDFVVVRKTAISAKWIMSLFQIVSIYLALTTLFIFIGKLLILFQIIVETLSLIVLIMCFIEFQLSLMKESLKQMQFLYMD